MAKPRPRRFSPSVMLEDAYRRYLDGHSELNSLRSEQPAGFHGRLAGIVLDTEEAKLLQELIETWTAVVASRGQKSIFGGREGAEETNKKRTAAKEADIARWKAWAKPQPPCPSHSAEAHRIERHFGLKHDSIRRKLPKRETW